MQNMDRDPVKDEHNEYTIPFVWRPTLREIVKSIARGDYSLSRGFSSVAPVSSATAKQIREYIEDYGETLIELPDETWTSSVARWMRTHWYVLVDLWTEEAGRSDLALILRIFEADDGFRFEVDSVHVP
jgi:hypothetical protein